MEDFTDEHDVYEKHKADNAQRNKLWILNIRQAVSDSAAEDNDICEKEDEVAGPAMNLAQFWCALLCRPGLVTIVTALEGHSKGPAQHWDDCSNDDDEAQDRVHVVGPAPAKAQANF